MGDFCRAPRVAAAAFGLLLALSGLAAAQSSGGQIVEEALKGVEQDQARDSQRVKEIVDEAVRGTQQAPSGQDTVNPAAPETLRPLADKDAPGVLPVGYQSDTLIGRPIDDGTGARIGSHSRPGARRGQRHRSGHGRVPAPVRSARQDLRGRHRVAEHGDRAGRRLRHGADLGRILPAAGLRQGWRGLAQKRRD